MTPQERKTENHRRFLRALDESEEAVMQAARWLRAQGFPVRINPTFRAPTADQWRDYSDSGDLEITQRVEVKRLSREFTGIEDWPFGKDYIVTSEGNWRRMRPKPYAFITFNRSMTHAGIVYSRDSERWYVQERRDGRLIDMKKAFIFAPIESVRWQRMTLQPQG